MNNEDNLMKWLLLGIGIAAAVSAAVGAAAAYRKCRNPDSTDCIEGGVRHDCSGEDAPKVIESTEITDFICEFSLHAIEDAEEIGNGVYKFSAKKAENGVQITAKWRDRFGNGSEHAFTADADFLEALQETISLHDLAKHNGCCHSVSGLPDMYGALLDVKYASGESIYAYNNQDTFLSREVMAAIFSLFQSLSEKQNQK